MLAFCWGEAGDRLEISFPSCLSLPGWGCGCVPLGGWEWDRLRGARLLGLQAAAAERLLWAGLGLRQGSHSCFHRAQGGSAETGTWPLPVKGLSYPDSRHLCFLVSHLCLLL